ncbi:Unknown protein, partial [Striga hermonthica]
RSNETLREFIQRFNGEALEIEDLDQSVALAALMNGVRKSSRFAFSLAKKPPLSLPDLFSRAEKYINAEEMSRAEDEHETSERKRTRDPGDDNGGKRKKVWDRLSVTTNSSKDRSNLPRFERYTPLRATKNEVLMYIRDKDYVKWPTKMRTPANKRSRDKYCRFHRDHGHDTEDCETLKNEIEDLIRRGYLKKFVGKDRSSPQPRRSRSKDRSRSPRRGNPRARSPRRDNTQVAGVIAEIAGGPSGGESNSARKAYARQPRTSDPQEKKARRETQITFTEEDTGNILTPHDDPMVVTLTIGNYGVKRVLVDSGSSADIIFYDAFEKMKIGRERLRPVKTPLMGFTGETVEPEGIITLPLTAGDSPQQTTVMMDFLVVKVPSGYNVILGRPGLNKMKAI